MAGVSITGQVSGGRLRVDADRGEAVGELVFEGLGVMMGYAETPADLALGRSVHELRTGDLGRLRDDGLFEVVGRVDRTVKVFGLRIDHRQTNPPVKSHEVSRQHILQRARRRSPRKRGVAPDQASERCPRLRLAFRSRAPEGDRSGRIDIRENG